MKVTAVILNWNGEQYITNCLDSLVQSRLREEDSLEIVVVDNASTDKSVELVRRKFPECRIITKSVNLGLAEGNNVGLQAAVSHHSDFVWLLNPSVIVRQDSLVRLIEGMEKYTDAGILAAKVYFHPGYETNPQNYKQEESGRVLWYAGGEIDWEKITFRNRGEGEVDSGQYDEDADTHFVTRDSMFIRVKAVDETGEIDTRYFQYLEDYDFCRKIRGRGWRLIYYPECVIWRARSRTGDSDTPQKDYYLTRNRLMFGLKYASSSAKFNLVKQSVKLYFSGRPWQRRAILDYFTGNMGPGSYQLL